MTSESRPERGGGHGVPDGREPEADGAPGAGAGRLGGEAGGAAGAAGADGVLRDGPGADEAEPERCGAEGAASTGSGGAGSEDAPCAPSASAGHDGGGPDGEGGDGPSSAAQDGARGAADGRSAPAGPEPGPDVTDGADAPRAADGAAASGGPGPEESPSGADGGGGDAEPDGTGGTRPRPGTGSAADGGGDRAAASGGDGTGPVDAGGVFADDEALRRALDRLAADLGAAPGGASAASGEGPDRGASGDPASGGPASGAASAPASPETSPGTDASRAGSADRGTAAADDRGDRGGPEGTDDVLAFGTGLRRRRRGGRGDASAADIPDGAAADGTTARFPAPAPAGAAPSWTDDGESAGEERLRGVLHGLAGGLEPHPDALVRLQRAVPRRRHQRRQALVGAGALLAIGATVLPMAVHTGDGDTMADPPSGSTRRPVSSEGPSVSGGLPRVSNSPSTTAGRSSGATPPDKPGTSAGRTGAARPDGGRGTSSGPTASSGGATDEGGRGGVPAPPVPTGTPRGPVGTGVPSCGPSDLGQASATSNADGGSFQFTNVSGRPCRLAGAGEVTASGGTAVSGGDFRDASVPTLVEGAAFTVTFSYSRGSCSGDGGSGNVSAAPKNLAEEAPSGDRPRQDHSGSVTVSYTPAGGAEAASTTISPACGGSITWSPPKK